MKYLKRLNLALNVLSILPTWLKVCLTVLGVLQGVALGLLTISFAFAATELVEVMSVANKLPNKGMELLGYLHAGISRGTYLLWALYALSFANCVAHLCGCGGQVERNLICLRH